MTVRRVEIRLTSTGFAELSKSLDQIDLKLDRLKAKFDELSKKVISPKVEVGDLAKSDAELDKFSLKLDEIGRKRVTAHVGVSTDSGTFRRDTKKLWDDLSGGGGGGGGGGRSLFSRLFHLGGGGGGVGQDANTAASAASGGGGVGGGLLSAVGGANNSYFGGLIAALIGVGAAISPAIIPFGVGGTVGLGAGGGAYALGSAEHQKLLTLEQSLSGASKKQAKLIQQQMAAIQKNYAPELGLYGSVGKVGSSALGVFNTALTTRGPGYSAGPSGQPGGPSFIQGLDGILKQVDGFIKSIGPQLGQMFRASLPFISAFAKIMEQLAKALMPAFTQTMKELQPYLPQIIQGFKYLSMGIATFIKNLGPGMKNGAIVFKAVMAGVGDVLGFLGEAFSGLADYLVKWAEKAVVDVHQVHDAFDQMRHDTAVIFDGMRHEIAHIWDMLWNDSLGAALNFTNRIARDISNWRHDIATTFDGIRHDAAAIWDHFWSDVASAAVKGWHQDISQLDSWRHDIANTFDNIRHDIATIWDNAWHDLINAGRQFAGTVVGGFVTLGKDIWNVVRHLPGQLWNIGKEAITGLWNGMKSVSGGMFSWFKNLIGGNNSLGLIGIAKKLLGIHSPSTVFYDIGKNMMLGLEHGLKANVGKAMSTLHGAFSNLRAPPGGGSVERMMQAMAASVGWTGPQWTALYNVEMAEAGFNLSARNPSSGAYGLAQFINGPSEYAQYGGNAFSAAGQITGMLNYIRERYGSPERAWEHEQQFHWYGKGGWINEPVVGVGMRSGDSYGFGERGSEYVSPHGSAGGNIYISVNGDTDPQAAAVRIWHELRDLKRMRGNQALGLG